MAGKYDNTRGLVSKTMLGKLSETLGFKDGLSYKQLMTKTASLSQKAVKQALKMAGWKGAAALAVVEAAGYGASKLMEKGKDRPTTKSKTKTYAEMVKEDKAKGKAKVLERRKKNKKPEPKPRPKVKDKQFNLKEGGKGTAEQRFKEIAKEKLVKKQKELGKKG